MKYFYLIAPSKVIRADAQAFTYHSEQQLPIGCLVRVTVGKKPVNGVIMSAVTAAPRFATKPIDTVLAVTPLPQPLLKLATWLSTYYATHLALVLQTMLPTGLHRTRRTNSAVATHPKRNRTNIVLNNYQSAAIQAILNGQATTYLLHGVTGSGKTEVYIAAVKQQIEQGNSSIVLVPEIALTPQLVAEFANHFEHLILTHSAMGEAQRHKAWLQALDAEKPCVVIGPRSALFMPLAKVGLVIVDECHEPSYKQEQSPRYSALRAATVLAKLHSGKAILGSATPSITDYYLAESTKNPILKLPTSIVAMKPAITVLVDAKNRDNFRKHHFLSKDLLESIEQAMERNQQTLLFHNRRGSAPTTMCEHCGWLAQCPTCTMPLILHADHHQLRCHVCGLRQSVPPSCPVCHEPTIAFKGIGTKLIETEIAKLFPKARIARFDADVATEHALHNRYQELYEGNIDIAIGTQMLVKGFDLPKLALVGIIQGDNGLLIPDYQADERVFQLVSQVMGRVGRQKHEGRIVIQAYRPDHPTLQSAIKKDYSGFYASEIAQRRKNGFPPFRYLLKLTCTYKTERGAIQASRTLAGKLRQQFESIEILGPAPAFYERLGGKYRWQLIVKASSRSPLIEIAKTVDASWQYDLDPMSLL